MATTKDDLLRVVDELIGAVAVQTAASQQLADANSAVTASQQAQSTASGNYVESRDSVARKLDELKRVAADMSDDDETT